MQSLKIILLCIISAVVYGILHDQITARVCVEYFTVGHPPIFHTESPTLLAFGWGIVATWWVGLILGILAALASRLGSWPKLDAARLVWPIVGLLVVMAVASLVAGIGGYEIAKAGVLKLPEPLASRLPTARHNLFFADWWAHQTAYGVGFFGGITLCVWVLLRRKRIGRVTPSVDDGGNHLKILTERSAIAVARWTARIIGIAILGLIVALAIGEGVPNPLRGSFREHLLGIGILTMLIGQIVAWKWEGIGSILILGGFALFAIVNHRVPLNVVFGPWLVTGLLYLICWWRTPKPLLGEGFDMDNQTQVWQRQDLAKLFLEDVRGGIPLAAEQIDVLLRVVRHAIPQVGRLLDLGCGDGILGRMVMAEYPKANAVFLDFSEHMIEAAKKKADIGRATFVVQDLGAKTWVKSVGNQPFDLVLSGLAIHHLPNERKRALYQEVFGLLKPGGLFLNLEHVAPNSEWAKQAFDDLFVDSLWSHHQKLGGTKTREAVEKEWYNRPDKTENILAPVEVQCQWLQAIGFGDVDCFFKLFQLALFGGKKPE